MLAMMPLNQASITAVSRDETGDAIGVAMIRESVNTSSVLELAHRTGDAAYSHLQALGQLSSQIQQQAIVITYSQTLYLLSLTLAACIPLTLLLKPSGPQKST
ncbi:hypothetical protein KQH49_10685 [Mycetohabitans sp. B5]|uniref:Uncharacterized protein n=1 Tax=Mycetohabitans endofungorum TaxID=417203 RepID=A0A2P5K863_9BURK|nr:hypothetical protein [Mycetohabitans sp. B5]PPB82906.1 hypothetical protein B0O95_11283 [Mycetohabitans endofungorum]